MEQKEKKILRGKRQKKDMFWHDISRSYVTPVGQRLKLIYSEKATNFSKSSPYFWLQYIQSKVRWRFRKILWPSQNIWTLANDSQPEFGFRNLTSTVFDMYVSTNLFFKEVDLESKKTETKDHVSVIYQLYEATGEL